MQVDATGGLMTVGQLSRCTGLSAKALHGNGGCEITVLATWLRGREDRVGCPLLAPLAALGSEPARRRS